MKTKPDAAAVRAFAEEVVSRLRDAGHEALFAGGCVRDLLLGKTPKDYDIATSARPDEVQSIFPRTVAVGVSFGVVRVVKGPHLAVEVATFRADGEYKDGRRPEAVRFTDAREDAQRRDFTINGMFLEPSSGEVHDFVGGRDDLAMKRLRAIGNPQRRFQEDKLRLLRAVRFAARLEFTIDDATFLAIQGMAHKLAAVSGERILMELRALFELSASSRGFRLLDDLGLARVVFAEASAGLNFAERVDKVVATLDRLPIDAPFAMAIAVIFALLDDEPVGAAECFFVRLKGSNEEREFCDWLLRRRNDLGAAASQKLSFRKRLFAHRHWRPLSAFSAAIGFEEGAAWCENERSSMTAEEIDPPILVTGDDLRLAGHTPGPKFKDWLDQIRDLQLEGKIASKEEAINRVEEWAAD